VGREEEYKKLGQTPRSDIPYRKKREKLGLRSEKQRQTSRTTIICAKDPGEGGREKILTTVTGDHERELAG